MSLGQRILILGLFVVCGCLKSPESKPRAPEIQLQKSKSGDIQIVARGFQDNVRALQFELSIQSADTFTVRQVKAAAGLPLDAVKAAAFGQNRSRFFIGDKRGIQLRRDGVLATFQLLRTNEGQDNGLLKLENIKITNDRGELIAAKSGPNIYVY